MARIMAVDDSPSLRALLSRALQQAGHEVLEAQDGVNALSLAQSEAFQLVICDVNMPNMDGLTFLKRFRGLTEHKFTPFLLLTTEIDPEKKKMAKEAGATGWVVKPFDPVQLLATIRKVLD